MYNRKGAILIDCFVCHEPFSVAPYKISSGKPLCCSRTCEGSRRRMEKREVRTCKECNTTFEVRKSELSKGPGRGTYCSMKCHGARTKEVHTGKIVSLETRAKQSAAKKGIIPWNKQPPVTAICPSCHEWFEYRPATRVKGIQTFCNQDCSKTFIRNHPEINPRYRGGREKGYGPNWPKLAESIRARDSYTCQNCGLRQTKPKLHVHHIQPRRSFNGDFELANDSSNLVTLCVACHMLLEPR